MKYGEVDEKRKEGGEREVGRHTKNKVLQRGCVGKAQSLTPEVLTAG